MMIIQFFLDFEILNIERDGETLIKAKEIVPNHRNCCSKIMIIVCLFLLFMYSLLFNLSKI